MNGLRLYRKLYLMDYIFGLHSPLTSQSVNWLAVTLFVAKQSSDFFLIQDSHFMAKRLLAVNLLCALSKAVNKRA